MTRLSVALGRFIRAISSGGARDLIESLVAQVDVALQGADLAQRAISSDISSIVARDQVQSLEHLGDRERRKLVEALERSFMAPFDREDVFRVSRSLDDVLDNLRDFIKELDMLGIQGNEHSSDSHLAEAVRAIATSLKHLRNAVALLPKEIRRVPDAALAAKKSSNQIRDIYQHGLVSLFEAAKFDMIILKRRELLRRLDIVGLRLGEAADALADGAVKRSG